MNCKQAQESLQLLEAGLLSGREARDIRLHLAACRECASGLDAAQWAEMLPVLDETIEPSIDFGPRFQEKLSNRRHGWWSGMRAWGWPRQVGAVGALAAVIIAGLFLIYGRNVGGDRSLNDFAVAERLPLFEDMAVVSNLELLENFEVIENLPRLMGEGAKN